MQNQLCWHNKYICTLKEVLDIQNVHLLEQGVHEHGLLDLERVEMVLVFAQQ